jgi:hypothetical protein
VIRQQLKASTLSASMEMQAPTQAPSKDVKAAAEMKSKVDMGRFVFTLLNFGMTVLFAVILLAHAFQMETITGKQVFFADRVLQSFTDTAPTEIDAFVKKAYGAETEITEIVDEITVLPTLLPKMYEISGSNSIMRLESVHCNFMLFSALWIASAFSLAMVQYPGKEPLQWDTLRVVVVHAWNLIGLIFTIVLFSATTKWGSIPTSNLFYAGVGQVMAWMYQYFHMVECTQVHVENLKIAYKSTQIDPLHVTDTSGDLLDIGVSTKFSSELRKIIYMEFSVVAPMIFVAGMMPGAIGIDEWRVQTVLFSSWTLFALLGLHLRYRKTLQSVEVPSAVEGKQATDDSHIDAKGLDALGYLTYALIMVYAMLLNAIGSNTFEDPPYATERIIQCRWGVRVLVAVTGFLVFETLAQTIKIRFWPATGDNKRKSEWWMVPPFIENMLIIATGSLMVNILMFAGLSDVNALSTWYS